MQFPSWRAAAGFLIGFGAVALPMLAPAQTADDADPRLAFRRPVEIPVPSDNPYTPAKALLGERLFHDVRLSGNDSRSCATCHVPAKAWQDGLRTGLGIHGDPLPRRTPSLADTAFAKIQFWDGRAATLEAQAFGPIENPNEMNMPREGLIDKLRASRPLVAEFAKAFPERPQITAETVAAALATFERTLRSGESPFDRFVAGDDGALSPAARRGFDLFRGKANCVTCHSGWRLTDDGFHDIGLSPMKDRGRGEILADPRLDFAMKTPSLRDVGRLAPYMHDGRFATLEDVVRHYKQGIEPRSTVSAELKPITLDDAETADLVAFLNSLTADRPAQSALAFSTDKPPHRVATSDIYQKGRRFAPEAVVFERGRPLDLHNDDDRVHNIRVDDPRFHFNSGLQKPGETVEIDFPLPGTFEVVCGIHPSMRLAVEVR